MGGLIVLGVAVSFAAVVAIVMTWNDKDLHGGNGGFMADKGEEYNEHQDDLYGYDDREGEDIGRRVLGCGCGCIVVFLFVVFVICWALWHE